ncbi:MAG: glycosyltransferase [Opitutus sp.]|nr:glycosyltransferase [Opitutus sp.]
MPDRTPVNSGARPVVLAMLKTPRPGTVKTRLGVEIGFEQAAQIYRLLAERQLSAVPTDWRTEIHFAPAGAGAEMQAWLGARHGYFPQVEGDLGRRLSDAVAGAFGRGADSVLVVGGDCPDLNEAGLREAATALQTSDAVLGPALDGGYYLIGLHRPALHVFNDIPWSTGNVLEATLARIAEGQLSHALLTPKEDIDDFSALSRFISQTADPGFSRFFD